ncbi:MAG: CehA/McbA family metallohydrolase [bacterium]|nr:CehA/McbA family metallohydrolase [bacterium]
MPSLHEGPVSPLFRALRLKGTLTLKGLAEAKRVSNHVRKNAHCAPSGDCTLWGIPFRVGKAAVLTDKAVSVPVDRLRARWLVFMHTADVKRQTVNEDGFISPTRGHGRLGETVARYVIRYEDGSEVSHDVRRRHQIGMVSRGWGENCFECVHHRMPRAIQPPHERCHPSPGVPWGQAQTRAMNPDAGPWNNWLWAWENPYPKKPIAGLRFEPVSGCVIVSAVSAGNVASLPLRWERRRKAVVRLQRGEPFDPAIDESGQPTQIQLDLGRVISAQPRLVYPDADWARTSNNALPKTRDREVIIEYTAHPEARLHVGERSCRVATLAEGRKAGSVTPVAPSAQRVRLRVVDKEGGAPVTVKLHVHGEAGEYLAPVDRHRIPNPAWFEDYSADFSHADTHHCTYIPGECTIDLPVGRVYVEISKGFEIKPLRKVVDVKPGTRRLSFSVSRVLPWRDKGWVSADTHVHFLSPPTAGLEGAGEGVNVVNLLASQWGELMTNVGDFDGKTTFGSREAGGDGEYLVRVGTENRQHVLGHISLIGYQGNIIAPMTTGGADESALGDPVDVLLLEWARQCHQQGGLVVLPHFPNPRAEHAAAVVSGDIDAVEMTSWGDLYSGIDPYSLSDWYRYLNCGYFVPAVGGTDKMAASTAVGTVRTYAKLRKNLEFTFDAWMDAVRAGETFVTYGPLLEFSVEGRPAGAQIDMSAKGGTVDVEWAVASVTTPMTRVDLVVNGEIRESRRVRRKDDAGSWRVKVARSAWMALLVRGQHAGMREIVAAHSSPVMVRVAGSPFFAAADAVTILDQIEGAVAYLDTVGTRAETKRYRQMRMLLTSAHRKLHNRLHECGHDHRHTPATDHPEHHR